LGGVHAGGGALEAGQDRGVVLVDGGAQAAGVHAVGAVHLVGADAGFQEAGDGLDALFEGGQEDRVGLGVGDGVDHGVEVGGVGVVALLGGDLRAAGLQGLDDGVGQALAVVVGAVGYGDALVAVAEDGLGEHRSLQQVAGGGAEVVAAVLVVGEVGRGVGAGALHDLGAGDGVDDRHGHARGGGAQDGVHPLVEDAVGGLVGLGGVAGLVAADEAGQFGF